jgi:hypothetical protein
VKVKSLLAAPSTLLVLLPISVIVKAVGCWFRRYDVVVLLQAVVAAVRFQ